MPPAGLPRRARSPLRAHDDARGARAGERGRERALLAEDAKRSRAGYETDLADAQKHDAAFEARRTAQLLSEARVIGATTTGAAKYGALLRALAPQIIVVEEAAEVLEAHVIAALSPRTHQGLLVSAGTWPISGSAGGEGSAE